MADSRAKPADPALCCPAGLASVFLRRRRRKKLFLHGGKPHAQCAGQEPRDPYPRMGPAAAQFHRRSGPNADGNFPIEHAPALTLVHAFITTQIRNPHQCSSPASSKSKVHGFGKKQNIKLGRKKQHHALASTVSGPSALQGAAISSGLSTQAKPAARVAAPWPSPPQTDDHPTVRCCPR